MRASSPSRVIVIGCLGLMAAFFALAGDEAHAAVSCGDTITADTTLHADLVDCPNNGLLIGADDITLNLNGHTIDGDGSPAAGCDPQSEFCDTGVANDQHDGITVKHGSLRQFDAGINVFGPVQHSRVLGVSAKGRVVGISLLSASGALIRNSSGSHAFGPEAFAGLGIFVSDHVRVLHNSFRHNAGDHSMILFESPNNLIKGNRFSGNDGPGLLVDASERNRITQNRFVRNGAGIALIKHGGHNRIRNNVVKDSRADGFEVGRKERHNRLTGNLARGSGDDGFDIASRSTTLTDNRANRNGDLGIEAARGVNDGGGNVAHHNGDPRQCTHIRCN